MADLGAIGIKYADEALRLIPLAVTTPTGTAQLPDNPLSRVIFDCADAKNISSRNTPLQRAFVQDFWRIAHGRKAAYLQDWKEIRGTVENSSAVGISRRVLALTAQGQCVGAAQSSAVDGTFTMVIDNCLEAILIVALPDPGDVRNAVVKWGVIPVT